MSFVQIITETYLREFEKVKNEINAYKDPSRMWAIEGAVNNSAGNLCLHLIGNLNHFIGATLGHTGYVRYREAEFNQKNVPVETMNTLMDDTLVMVKAVLEKLTDEDLEKTYPVHMFGEKSTQYMLMFFTGHLSYHLGQISYHRRLLDK
jgi:uncharacterized damage-inducible protein DinB